MKLGSVFVFVLFLTVVKIKSITWLMTKVRLSRNMHLLVSEFIYKLVRVTS